MQTTIAFDVYATLVNPLANGGPFEITSWRRGCSFRRTVAYKAARIFVPARADARISALFGLHLGGIAFIRRKLWV
jgi:hypothetical protein